MPIKDYRKQHEADIAKAAKKAISTEKEYAAERLEDVKGGADEKAHAIASTSLTVDNLGDQIEQLCKILLKKSESVKVRDAVITQLNMAEFFGPAYEPHRAKVEEALRSVATDKSSTIRHAALQNLALKKDDYARDILKKSLNSDNEDVIDDAGAIRLLGLDDHGEVAKIAKAKFEKLSAKAKKEAVRVLVGDPGSSGLLSKIMKDKSHGEELRKLSAIGLQKLDSSEFLKNALKAVRDKAEDPKVQAAYINTAKVEFEDVEKAAKKVAKEGLETLAKRAKKLRKETRSRILKGAVKRFVDKTDKL